MKRALGGLRWRSVQRATHTKVDFTDTQKAYGLKSFSELLRHYVVYKLFSVTSIVRHSDKVCVCVCLILLPGNCLLPYIADGAGTTCVRYQSI